MDIRSHLVRGSFLALTAVALAASIGHALARTIHDSSDEALAHRFGRAGVLSGSTRVEAPKHWMQGQDPVGVSYDAETANRTNMPREQRHEGPVSDRTPPLNQDTSHG